MLRVDYTPLFPSQKNAHKYTHHAHTTHHTHTVHTPHTTHASTRSNKDAGKPPFEDDTYHFDCCVRLDMTDDHKQLPKGQTRTDLAPT
jgi:hypothetical protein